MSGYRMCDTHNEILFSITREGHPDIVTVWLNLEGIMLNEISQTQKDMPSSTRGI